MLAYEQEPNVRNGCDGPSGTDVQYDYNNNIYTIRKNNCSVRPSSFNGDTT